MLSQTAKLLEANDGLRDTLEEASVGVARNARRLASLGTAEQTDSLTDLSSRAGLERTLAEWWRKDPLRVRQLTMAMIDVDEFGRLNDRVGRNVCDRILRAMAQLLKAVSHGHSVAARFSGQRFVLLFADVDLRFTTNVAERIRQTIETARFVSQGDDIRLTVSCGVVEATSEDTSDTLYARAEATLREAKRYGRNRTFIHEGKYPTPVVPPNFALEEKSVPI
jgi:diguanylate cyclase